MSQPPPKRRPGDPNPTASPNGPHGPDAVQRQSQMSNAHGDGDFGIVRGVTALIGWIKRRRATERR